MQNCIVLGILIAVLENTKDSKDTSGLVTFISYRILFLDKILSKTLIDTSRKLSNCVFNFLKDDDVDFCQL